MKRQNRKRNKTQRAKDTQKAAAMRSEGDSLRTIASALDVAPSTVKADLDGVDQLLLKKAMLDREAAMLTQLNDLQFAVNEAKRAWALSLEDSEKVTFKASPRNGDEHTTTTEGQSGNPGHLRNLVKAVEVRSKLLGLYQAEPNPEKPELTDAEKLIAEQIKEARAKHAAQFPQAPEPGTAELP
jgi:hypothetical protein